MLPTKSHIPICVSIPWGLQNQADVVLSWANRRKVEYTGADVSMEIDLKHVEILLWQLLFSSEGWPGNLVCYWVVLSLFGYRSWEEEGDTVSLLTDTHLVRGEKRGKSWLPGTQCIDSLPSAYCLLTTFKLLQSLQTVRNPLFIARTEHWIIKCILKSSLYPEFWALTLPFFLLSFLF